MKDLLDQELTDALTEFAEKHGITAYCFVFLQNSSKLPLTDDNSLLSIRGIVAEKMAGTTHEIREQLSHKIRDVFEKWLLENDLIEEAS